MSLLSVHSMCMDETRQEMRKKETHKLELLALRATHSIHLFGWEKSGMISSFDTHDFDVCCPFSHSHNTLLPSRLRLHRHTHTRVWLAHGNVDCVRFANGDANVSVRIANCRKYRIPRRGKFLWRAQIFAHIVTVATVKDTIVFSSSSVLLNVRAFCSFDNPNLERNQINEKKTTKIPKLANSCRMLLTRFFCVQFFPNSYWRVGSFVYPLILFFAFGEIRKQIAMMFWTWWANVLLSSSSIFINIHIFSLLLFARSGNMGFCSEIDFLANELTPVAWYLRQSLTDRAAWTALLATTFAFHETCWKVQSDRVKVSGGVWWPWTPDVFQSRFTFAIALVVSVIKLNSFCSVFVIGVFFVVSGSFEV